MPGTERTNGSNEMLLATYEVPASNDAEWQAEQIAVSMTVGSWTDLPGLEQKRLSRHRGVVVGVEAGEETARFTIGYPAINLPPQLSSALTVAFGKVSLDGQIRLVNLEFPASWTRTLPGPRHGVRGLRARLTVHDRPLLMSIFKSENGRTLDEFGRALWEQWSGGADLVKDDEIFFADRRAPLRDRVQVARDLQGRAETLLGYRPLYALNLTAAGPDIPAQAQKLIELGAEAFLVSPWTVGIDVLADVANLPGSPLLLAHPAFSGAFVSPRRYGMAADVALGKLWRAAGADVGIFPSPYGSVVMEPAEALAVGRALQEPGPRPPAWPAPSAGIHPGLVTRLVRDFGRDVIINAGGAIHGHPAGTAAGARAFRQALDRVAGPVPPELQAALDRWGGTVE
jgi:2,3-diketo-5-methylthiopentyl-1-phosphate enolase